MVPLPGKRHRGRNMHPVLGSDNNGICKAFKIKNILPVLKSAFFGDTVHIAQPVPEKILRIRHGHDFGLFRDLQGMPCVNGTPASGSDKDKFDFFHDHLQKKPFYIFSA
jgi:hypothetical protein